MTSSSLSVYQQHAAKLLSRKSVVLGIPIAAGSIILFLQWRKRKSLKPKPKPKSKQPESEKKEDKVEESRTNGKATHSVVEEKTTASASAQNGSASAPAAPPADSSESYAAIAAGPPPAYSAAAPSSSPPQYSPIRAKHSQDDSDDQRVTGFAYAKRPRLGRGRSVEKFASYEPLRKASAEQREQEEKLRIKEEDDKAAAAAVAAFSPPAVAAAAAAPEPELAPISAPAVPEDEDVPPEAPIPALEPEPEAAPAEADVAPEETFEVKVNGWHHDDEGVPMIEEPVRDMRRPSIIATFEITTTSEPANLSPPGSAAYDTSRRPSVVTTISAEPAINEEDEDDWEVEEPEQTPAFPPRRESVTVETAIEIAEARLTNGMNGIHEEDEIPAHGVSTVISGPIPVTSASQEDYDDDEEWAPEDPVPEPASTALAKAMDTGVQGDEESKRTDSPLASKPVVVSAAVGVPAPQSAIVEEIKEVVERAPLAHLPGMGIPNSA